MLDLESILGKQTIHYACKFRIYPTEKQKAFFKNQFGCCRFVYNHFLDYAEKVYKKEKRSVSIYKEVKPLLSIMKQTNEYGFLKEVNSQSLQQSVLNLGKARSRFFDDEGGKPRFKRKVGRQSFEIPQHFLLKKSKGGNYFLFIPKLKQYKDLDGRIKIKVHRQIRGDIRHVTIIREADGRYYASLNCRLEEYCVRVIDPKKGWKTTGYDFGVVDLLVGSDGTRRKAPRSLRKSEKKVKTRQRKHSKKKKGSNNKEKSRIELARCHTDVKNQRKDCLHQTSNEVVNENQVLYFETLCPKNMMKNRRFAKSLSDASPGEILRQAKYKSNWRNKKVVQIGRFVPSSKLCSTCGAKNNELKLHHRVWTCKECGVLHDRDINAAINIKKIGQDMSKSTPVERTTNGCLLARGQTSWLMAKLLANLAHGSRKRILSAKLKMHGNLFP